MATQLPVGALPASGRRLGIESLNDKQIAQDNGMVIPKGTSSKYLPAVYGSSKLFRINNTPIQLESIIMNQNLEPVIIQGIRKCWNVPSRIYRILGHLRSVNTCVGDFPDMATETLQRRFGYWGLSTTSDPLNQFKFTWCHSGSIFFCYDTSEPLPRTITLYPRLFCSTKRLVKVYLGRSDGN